MHPYRWLSIQLPEHRFLSALATLLDPGHLEAFIESDEVDFSRISCDGFVTLRGRVGGKPFGVVFNDFRVRGGSFGKKPSRRVTAFLDEMGAERTPVLMVLNSIGARLMEGRTVFNDALSVVPAIERFSSRALLYTFTPGRVLGLGALAYMMGHYRIAIAGKSLLNLTGPEVFNLFFGTRVCFEEIASAERQATKNNAIHELVQTEEAAYTRIRALVTGAGSYRQEIEGSSPTVEASAPEKKLRGMLAMISDGETELFAKMSPVVRAFLVKRGSRKYGILINPPGNPHNLITVAALQKYSVALDYFRAAGVPVISFLDTPGADPRVEQADRDLIGQMLSVARKIATYPYGKMGVVVGRAFGGATIFGMPKLLGSLRCVALEGCRMGIMDESILTQVLSGSPRLLEEWKATAAKQSPDLKDMVEADAIDAVIQLGQLPAEIDAFLDQAQVQMATSRVDRPLAPRQAPSARVRSARQRLIRKLPKKASRRPETKRA